ncbi:hypothetical protein [Nocardiopsis sp. FR4]|uniref:hypothetical protein n=1 Tax=Nocardiopsis sp. FR4 TaxID=2605985 RepID=UPI00135B43D6|nr:hypothetical protein [Nocardiopsis sp. FR4]
MTSLSSAPTAGAAVQPGTHQVMVWLCPAGQLAHLVPLPPDSARELATQLTTAADVADQLSKEES